MIKGKKVLALIPARGGSKRLPGKNIRNLVDKPLINWTIHAALGCEYVDNVIVSTDDESIAKVALECGAMVPELRPIQLSSDTASSEDVIRYAIDEYVTTESVIILLQPTSPLRSSKNIQEAIELFIEKKADSVISVTPCEHSPLWSNKLPKSGSLEGFLSKDVLKRSQELGDFYRLNGALYIFDIVSFIKYGVSYRENTFAYIMNNEISIDIDTMYDFDLAEFLIKKSHNS
ncbi:CMP-N-acetlyneuraminic acid synthetase [Marinomonas sp. S3726]|uniref:acylneuraminate cytidylyltransferase family protein n=1 Tax=Marinomonas sp. S3726 TaxID=579484 RepID=UPI0005FA3D99|nr:acylneuraminate cytidylyltransferase family protein [Marinomonas sp. S3726]KJZ15972.1 CMP-N-acetlyneuraminic acid synthetase [Marinomonas sp. S3726]